MARRQQRPGLYARGLHGVQQALPRRIPCRECRGAVTQTQRLHALRDRVRGPGVLRRILFWQDV